MQRINKLETGIIVLAFIAIASFVGLRIAEAAGNTGLEPEPSSVLIGESSTPVEPTLIEISASVGPLGFTDRQKIDAYSAFNGAERGVQSVMDAIAAIREGEIAGEPLTADQLTAIVDGGLAGMALAQARISDGLAILSLSQASLAAFTSANPVPDVVWCYETPENCAD